MRVSLESNIRAVERDLSDAGRKQLPFALSVALNDTARDVQKVETARLSRVIDRPTPFTKRAYAIRRSSKRRLEARVFVKDAQAKYLERLEDGGVRRPANRALIMPASIRLNKYGNIARGAIKRKLAGGKVFSGTPKGRARSPGIYERKRGKLVKVAGYAKRARYAPQLGFRRSAEKTVGRRFPVKFERALIRAWNNRRT